jgi:hypothetical protein
MEAVLLVEFKLRAQVEARLFLPRDLILVIVMESERGDPKLTNLVVTIVVGTRWADAT